MTDTCVPLPHSREQGLHAVVHTRWALFISYPAETSGWVGLGGWLNAETVYPQTVAHLGTNRVQHFVDVHNAVTIEESV